MKERVKVERNAANFKDIRQSLDEFFTPGWIAEIMFKLALKHGFKGGKILEPSFGHGVFFDQAVKNGIPESDLWGFELYKPNYDFTRTKYPTAHLFNHNFEYQFITDKKFFSRTGVERSDLFVSTQFDLVIGNPPYGKHTSPYAFYFDKKMQVRYEGFFIYLALQKLRPGGLLVFIINSLWLVNKEAYNYQKQQIDYIGEMIDAYRLPSRSFEETEIATDIIIMKKR